MFALADDAFPSRKAECCVNKNEELMSFQYKYLFLYRKHYFDYFFAG